MARTAEQIIAEIQNTWFDLAVAQWVISNLELLQLVDAKAENAPIHTVSITDGTYSFSSVSHFFQDKLIISGGIEGHRGHVDAVTYLTEARALMAGSQLRTLLLEPDSYIHSVKQREPLISQTERADFWSRSGLVDLVVCLPTKPDKITIPDHYAAINDALGSECAWFTTGEHPFFLEVLTRNRGRVINLLQLIPETVNYHSSFLAATKSMSEEELAQAILLYEEQLRQRLR